MLTVALTGADGAGKSTVIKCLMRNPPLPVKQIYMGDNLASSNFVLPTTLLWHKLKQVRGKQPATHGPPDPTRISAIPKNPLRRAAMELKSGLLVANLMAEEWFRQLMAWYYQVRGYVILFDRHFFLDYYAHHIASHADLPIGKRIHGAMLKHIFPKPNLVIFLDAPSEILFARKGEGTIETLERRRQEYLQFRNMVQHFVIVDATQPEDKVTKQVSDLILDFYTWKKMNYKRSHNFG